MSTKKVEEPVIDIETFESEFSGWRLSSWLWHNVWHVTAELFDRVTLRHGICWGHGPTREAAEMLAQKRITEGTTIKWTFYEKTEAGQIKKISKQDLV